MFTGRGGDQLRCPAPRPPQAAENRYVASAAELHETVKSDVYFEHNARVFAPCMCGVISVAT